MSSSLPPPDVESEVRRRYARGAAATEADLCCPTPGYDPRFLANLPAEIVERDYGCGDPSRWARPGDRVVDLGSGSGKIAYILAQAVGKEGEVVGVDFGDEMLTLARKYEDETAARIGYRNFRFAKARVQDLALDAERAEALLRERPVVDFETLAAFEADCARLRAEAPAVAGDWADLVVSNCVLNLVRPEDKERLCVEIFRVLRRGGRAVISDIVCDEDPTPAILADPALWSGCIAGAFREDRFLEMFERAGFYGVEIVDRAERPWRTIDGVEFRAMTVRAFKGKEGPCLERNQAVVYKGPWSRVYDDDGHVLHRGKRMAVCDKTFRIYTDPTGPYAAHVAPVEPLTPVAPEEAGLFACKAAAIRDPRESKGLEYRATEGGGDACGPDSGCC